jgi:hypothetical protein
MTARTRRRIPPFMPVPLRACADGWTPSRQANFLGALAETRSVRAAAERVGMARETAYRLRARAGAESFAAAWDAILGRKPAPQPKVTPEMLWHRALHGLLRPVMHRGRHVGTVRKPDNSALLRVIARLNRAEARGSQAQRARLAQIAEGSVNRQGSVTR